jgi:subtilase family serine protease
VVWQDNPGTNFQYFSTAGGVLTSDPIPFYQQSISMTQNQGSTQYRNVPDVALVARDIEIVFTSANTNGSPQTGTFSSWVGTSASAPLWSGIIALANQQAATQGQPPVGFLNPALYEIAQSTLYASCFHDITNGSNAWNNPANGTGSGNLYNAVPGYDLCTGWGSPASLGLINALVGYAGPVFVNFNYTGLPQNGQYGTPYSTLSAGVSAVANYGTIFILNGGSSAPTPGIFKPMTITAQGGAATIQN